MKCLNCEKDVPQTVGKRAKLYCSISCRSAHWQKKKRAGKEPGKSGRPPSQKKKPQNESREIQNADVTLPGGLGEIQTGSGIVGQVEKFFKKSDGSVTLTISPKSKEKKIEEIEAEIISSIVKLPTGFNELLTMAKVGVTDKPFFLKHVENTKMTPGQRGMIIAKLK